MAKQPKPVKAWAVVGKDGRIWPSRIQSHDGLLPDECGEVVPDPEGWRVVPVLITPVAPKPRKKGARR